MIQFYPPSKYVFCGIRKEVLQSNMRFALFNKLRFISEAASISGIKIHLKYWWYTRDRSRLLVLLVLVCILFLVGMMIRYSVIRQAQLQQLNCLALNIYHEARGEPIAGQYAVAEVTMNRVSSKRYPETICKVVYQKRWDSIRKRYVGAFSWTEIKPDREPDFQAWQQAKEIAAEYVNNEAKPRVHGAIFYHARHIRPSWSHKRTEVARIGQHIFYK